MEKESKLVDARDVVQLENIFLFGGWGEKIFFKYAQDPRFCAGQGRI